MALRKALLMAFAALPLLGFHGPEQGGRPAESPSSSALPYVRRGEQVEARARAYRERLERFHETLSARIRAEAPDLVPKLQAARPDPLPHGYQILPKLVPDPPAPPERPRAQSAWYTWPWTEQLIQREIDKIDGLEAELARIPTLPAAAQRAAYETLVADASRLRESQQTIDAHIQYNWLWQRAIADDTPGYNRQTVLHDAVLERQAVRDALGAADDAAFGAALRGVTGIDPAKPRGALEGDLRTRERTLEREIGAAIGRVAPPAFLRIEHPDPHRWILRVPFYTDIDDADFVRALQQGVERVWRLRDGEDEFGVELAITYLPPARLYPGRPGCGTAGHAPCDPPRRGAPIDVGQHVALFPEDGAVLTSGAVTTHVWGRAIALGPHDITRHVLAHELGHILGFPDFYFRGYKQLGVDGYQAMEVVADPDDIMGAPGTGPVLRRHFELLIDGAQRTP